MSSGINIYPFEDSEGLLRFGIQIFIFLVGCLVVYKMIIKPLMALYEERYRRTAGDTVLAAKVFKKAIELEKHCDEVLKKAHEDGLKLRREKIVDGEREAARVLDETKRKTSQELYETTELIHQKTVDAIKDAPKYVGKLSSDLVSKLTKVLLLSFFSYEFLKSTHAFSSDDIFAKVSFWDGIFWPYYQFVFFLVALIYFGRRPLKAYLEKKRHTLRTQLSEANEALDLARRKLNRYEEKFSELNELVRVIKEQKREDGDMERRRIISEAKKQSELILKESKRRAQELILRSQEDIRKELLSLAIKDINKKLSDDDLKLISKTMTMEAFQAIRKFNKG